MLFPPVTEIMPTSIMNRWEQLQIPSVASKHHGENNGGPNQWIIRVNITPQLLKIHLSLLIRSCWFSAGDVLTNGLG